MCQATVYLNGEVIMRDVLVVEPVPEGIRLITLFEPVQVVPAAIQEHVMRILLGQSDFLCFANSPPSRCGAGRGGDGCVLFQ